MCISTMCMITTLFLVTVVTDLNASLLPNTNEFTMDDFVSYSTRSKSSETSALPIEVPEEIVDGSFAMRAGLDEEQVDCFGLNPSLQRVFRWLFQPQSNKTIDVKFFLTTRKNRDRLELPQSNILDLKARLNKVDVAKNTVVIIHGFMSNSRMDWVLELEQALLDRSDVNVIAVDWGGGSLSWKYWRAVGNTRVVGAATAGLLHQLLLLGLSRQQIHCIGHSLGAHVCSFSANKLGVIGQITGLDPAQPCFHEKGLNSSDAMYVDVIHTNAPLLDRLGLGIASLIGTVDLFSTGLDPAQPCFHEKGLNSSDAMYVDVIHTNAPLLNRLGLGIASLIGTVDFFPNGGEKQPGCRLRDKSRFKSWLPSLVKELEEAICSHGRSYQVYIDSMQSTNCQLWGRVWDLSETGAIAALRKPCTPVTCVPLGPSARSFPGKGSFYVPTLDKPPYCVHDQKTEKQMTVWSKIRDRLTSKMRSLQKKWETF